jgi:Fur family peroxide stress response transcriptional regulator
MREDSYPRTDRDRGGEMAVSSAELERRMAEFKSVARRTGVKLTHQRLEIFREVASRTDHPAVDAIFRAVQARIPTVSLDTVYRTLWVLEELGVLSSLGPRHGAVRFDANLRRHHHYVCTRCGLTRDFESPAFDALESPSSVTSFGQVVATRVELRGVCRTCSRKTEERRAARGKKTASRGKRRDGLRT